MISKKHKAFRSMLMGSVMLTPMMLAANATAQDADEDDKDDVEEITVTGIRASLKSARDMKRNADTAVDTISASDVSTLPDLSVAEALARVPGVVVQRFGLGASDGDFPSPEGGDNLIRGLQLVRSEFNGRDAFSANGGRSLDFGTVPPELIGSVEVFKNSSADLIQGGIGGTINLRTLEPFDRSGRIAVVTVDGTYTDLRDEFTPDISVVLGDRWEVSSGEVGLLGSFSTSELKSSLEGFQIGQLLPIDLDGQTVAVPGGFQLRTNEVDRSRDSYYLAGQWRNEEGNLEVTAKYSRIENTVTSDERTLEWFSDGEMWFQTGPTGDYTTTPFSSNGLAQCNGSNDPTPSNPTCEMTQSVSALFESGVVSNGLRDWTGSRGANFTNLGIHQEEKSMTDDLSINIKWMPTEQLFVNIDAHKTSASFDMSRLWAGTRFYSDFELNADLDDPRVRLVVDPDNNPQARGGLTPAYNGDLSDPVNSFLLFAADEFQDNEGDMFAIKGDVQYDFDNDSWFESVKFGARYAERDQVNRSAGLNWAALAPSWGGGLLPMNALATPGFETVDFSNFFGGGVVTGDNTEVVFANRELLSDYDAFVQMVDTDPLITPDWNPLRRDGQVDWSRGTIGDIVEKTTDFYVRLDMGNEFDNGMSLDANVGLRYTKSSVSGQGQLDYNDITDDDARTLAPQTTAFFDQESIDRSGQFSNVGYWLPSLNVKWNVSETSLIRFAGSKQITRPNISQLRSSQVAVGALRYIVDEDTDPPTVTDVVPNLINIYGGNPNLEAIESWNFDLGYEYYFGEQDSFTFSLFYKDISNNIIYGSQTLETVTLDGQEVAIVYNGDLNQDEATIKGFEVAYQQFFTHLDGFLGHLGVQANYTYIDAKTDAPLPIVDADGDGTPDSFERIFRYGVNDYLGLSKHTANLIGIYQDDKLEVRLAYNWRSSHLSSYRDFVTGNPIIQQDRGYLDGSIKYELNDMMQLRVQVANILNTRAKADQQIDADGQTFGRTAFLGDRRIKAGIRFKF
ncbi:TonB-dependent receptor [Temperatibacter marinus]|uniref:TonB-dependent receptor n=1 Tax=Temperatibacter marinus TaxID=1456591 RepID=A0AA52EKA5_9PROT|nr:TonB-dependent receptor [Temperatibacter marinus]WND03581.1 TonB-dependent receptor [Temperatibacter marinus]